MDIVRIALIGTGSMGKKYAMMIDQGKIRNMMLTAVCCRSRENQQWTEENLHKEAAVYESAEEMYRDSTQFDAVMIVTPHKTHPQLAIQAFEHGKHVFCDKPSGISVLQCRRMNEAAGQYGKKFAIMFHQRLYEKYAKIKSILECGELGRVRRVLLENSRYFRTNQYHRSADWRSSWNGEGGGALINQGQHILDIWQWLFGMPESVYAEIPFGKYNDFQVDDEAVIMMNYPKKMTAVFILTTGEGTWTDRLEIIGTKGRLQLDHDTLHHFTYNMDIEEYGKTACCNAREELKEEYRKEEFPGGEEPYAAMLENFAAAVISDTPMIAEGTEGIRAIELTNAAYLSAWLGKRITIPVAAELYEQELQKKMDGEERKKND